MTVLNSNLSSVILGVILKTSPYVGYPHTTSFTSNRNILFSLYSSLWNSGLCLHLLALYMLLLLLSSPLLFPFLLYSFVYILFVQVASLMSVRFSGSLLSAIVCYILLIVIAQKINFDWLIGIDLKYLIYSEYLCSARNSGYYLQVR